MNQWQTIITDLQERGMTQQEIADAIPCSQNYISDLSRGIKGKRLSYEIAQGLLALHKVARPKQATA